MKKIFGDFKNKKAVQEFNSEQLNQEVTNNYCG